MLGDNVVSKIRSRHTGYVWHWLYKEHGRLLMIIARYEWKGDKTYRQFSYQEGEWKEGVMTTPYPLFSIIWRLRSAHRWAMTNPASMVFPNPTSSARITPFDKGDCTAKSAARTLTIGCSCF